MRTVGLVEVAIYAAVKHLEWIEKEHAGPDYFGLTRDTHPEGEVIWRRWWEDQLELCAETERLCRETIALAVAHLVAHSVHGSGPQDIAQ